MAFPCNGKSNPHKKKPGKAPPTNHGSKKSEESVTSANLSLYRFRKSGPRPPEFVPCPSPSMTATGGIHPRTHLTPGQQKVVLGAHNHGDVDALASIESDLPGFGCAARAIPAHRRAAQPLPLGRASGLHMARRQPYPRGVDHLTPSMAIAHAKVVGPPNDVANG